MSQGYESVLRTLSKHAWDSDVQWPEIDAWSKNFKGNVFGADEEQLYALFSLSRFMYFSKRLVREMLKALYRDHFEAPLIQRIRRNSKNSRDDAALRKVYGQELLATRFIGVGNPAESGAHLLYYFRQVNHLPKNLFVDFLAAFSPGKGADKSGYAARDFRATRYVFFDDLVGSATQVSSYLERHLARVRAVNADLDLRFMALFATTQGLEKLNEKALFDGKAMCLFELDDSYRAFGLTSRYFSHPPAWFQVKKLQSMASAYGAPLLPGHPLGYKNGQLLLGFSHNTPDNTLPIFWYEGRCVPWRPVFIRYDKNYGGTP